MATTFKLTRTALNGGRWHYEVVDGDKVVYTRNSKRGDYVAYARANGMHFLFGRKNLIGKGEHGTFISHCRFIVEHGYFIDRCGRHRVCAEDMEYYKWALADAQRIAYLEEN